MDRKNLKSKAGNKDAELLQKLTVSVVNGDQAAWEQIYLKLHDPLSAFIYRIVRSRDEAYDLTQETFITLWENRTKIDPEKNIRGYLYTVARNNALMCLRARSQGSAGSLENIPDIPAPGASSDDMLIADETKLLFMLALEAMPPKQREVFRMSRFEGLSHDEIARRLNINKRTVENHIHRAGKELKEIAFLVTFFLGAIS